MPFEKQILGLGSVFGDKEAIDLVARIRDDERAILEDIQLREPAPADPRTVIIGGQAVRHLGDY